MLGSQPSTLGRERMSAECAEQVHALPALSHDMFEWHHLACVQNLNLIRSDSI